MSERDVVVLPDAAALVEEAARRFVSWAAESIGVRGRFTVALAGGSTPAGLYRLLAQEPRRGQVAWEQTLLFFGDERCVPPDAADSNYHMARETLLAHVPAPGANVFRMPGEVQPGDAAAGQYAEALAQAFSAPGQPAGALPRFDLILLGMGDDGHTASLFPGMPALAEARRTVLWTPVPGYVRPAVPRLTLTLPVLNAARQVCFMVAGPAKAQALRAALSGDRVAAGEQAVPAALVQPADGVLTWLVDRAAAQDLAG